MRLDSFFDWNVTADQYQTVKAWAEDNRSRESVVMDFIDMGFKLEDKREYPDDRLLIEWWKVGQYSFITLIYKGDL